MSTKQYDLITADYDRKYEREYGLNYLNVNCYYD